MINVNIINLFQKDTGVPGRIRVSGRYGQYTIPRVMYARHRKQICFTVEDSPKILEPGGFGNWIPPVFQDAATWIALNKNVLIDYWNNPDYLSRKLLDNIKQLHQNLTKPIP